MFKTFADWASLVLVVEVGIIVLVLAIRYARTGFYLWVDWKTYRTAAQLSVLVQIVGKIPEGGGPERALPGNILKFTAIFISKDGRPMIWRHLSPVSFTPVGDMGLVPLAGTTVRPRDGYARCDFVATNRAKGTLGTVVAHSGSVWSMTELTEEQLAQS